jgi:hypothetical protein
VGGGEMVAARSPPPPPRHRGGGGPARVAARSPPPPAPPPAPAARCSNSFNDGEAYEQVLWSANHNFAWRKEAVKRLVVVGDDIPHGADFPGNDNHADWLVEAGELASKDVAVYAVQAPTLSLVRGEAFYRTLAEVHPRGTYLQLAQFAQVRQGG